MGALLNATPKMDLTISFLTKIRNVCWANTKKPRPYKRTRQKSRDTTFFRRQFTLSTSVSVRQHSGACNVRYYVAAYYPMEMSIRIRCTAQGCIPNLFPTRLSSTGSFLCVSQSCTCSCHSLSNASIRCIIDTFHRKCQPVFKPTLMRFPSSDQSFSGVLLQTILHQCTDGQK